MNTRSSTYNAIYKILNKNLHILYEPSNTFFDQIIQLVPLTLENRADSLYEEFHDVYMVSNVLDHASNKINALYNYGIPDLMCFHKSIPDKFKKEDLYIFKQAAGRSYKIIFHDTIRDSWTIKDKFTYNISYGLPDYEVIESSNKKSVVLLNTQKSHNLDNLYEYIKNTFKDATIIRDTNNMNYQDIIQIMSEHRLCIEHDIIINCLVAGLAGCDIITSLAPIDGLNGKFDHTDYSQILDTIGYRLNKPTRQIEKSKLLEQYSFDKFSSQLIKCIQDLKRIQVSI